MIDKILQDVKDELVKAQNSNAPMRNAHEGYAIILEELDELWDEVKTNPKKNSLREKNMRKEVIQVAAMAIRFVHDVCDCNPVPVEMREPFKQERVVRKITYVGNPEWIKHTIDASLKLGCHVKGVTESIVVEDITMGGNSAKFGKL